MKTITGIFLLLGILFALITVIFMAVSTFVRGVTASRLENLAKVSFLILVIFFFLSIGTAVIHDFHLLK